MASIVSLIDQEELKRLFDRSAQDGTIEGAILGVFDAVTEGIIEYNEVAVAPLPVFVISAGIQKNVPYRKLVVTQPKEYAQQYLEIIRSTIDNLVAAKKGLKHTVMQPINRLEKSLRENESSGFRNSTKDDVEIYRMETQIMSMKLAYIATMAATQYSFRFIQQPKELLEDLVKNLDLIQKIQVRQDIDIPEDVMSERIISLLHGGITRSGLLKIINKKPDIHRHVQSPEAVKLESATYTPKIYDAHMVAFLESRGIRHAKQIIDDNRYVDVQGFIESLETLFEKRGLSIEESRAVYQRNPNLLTMKSSEQVNMMQSIEDLFDLVNPIAVSGILPKNNSQLYSSADNIREYILQRTRKKSKVTPIGLYKISNENDRRLLSTRLENTPFIGTAVRKHKSQSLRSARTYLYDACCTIKGEGHYRKESFGIERSAIFKVEHAGNDTYNVTVIEYFETKREHQEFFRVKR